MLKDKNLSGKQSSIYICDRCGTEIENDRGKRYRLLFQTKSNKHNMQETFKTFDLCKHCCAVVNNVIQKKVERKNNEGSK